MDTKELSENPLDADVALADYYGSISIKRDVYMGVRGYTVKNASGIKTFHSKFSDAVRQVFDALGHREDRDFFIMGEPEGSAW